MIVVANGVAKVATPLGQMIFEYAVRALNCLKMMSALLLMCLILVERGLLMLLARWLLLLLLLSCVVLMSLWNRALVHLLPRRSIMVVGTSWTSLSMLVIWKSGAKESQFG